MNENILFLSEKISTSSTLSAISPFNSDQCSSVKLLCIGFLFKPLVVGSLRRTFSAISIAVGLVCFSVTIAAFCGFSISCGALSLAFVFGVGAFFGFRNDLLFSLFGFFQHLGALFTGLRQLVARLPLFCYAFIGNGCNLRRITTVHGSARLKPQPLYLRSTRKNQWSLRSRGRLGCRLQPENLRHDPAYPDGSARAP